MVFKFKKLDFLKNDSKTLENHFYALRTFIISLLAIYLIVFIISFYFSENLYSILSKPVVDILKNERIRYNLIVTDVTELFFNYLKITFYTSLIFFTPFFLGLGYTYVKPVLRKKFRNISIIIIILIPLLFVAGGIVAYYFGINIILNFFINFSLNKNQVELLPSVSSYIALILQVILAFGLSFELPVVMLMLYLFNIISEKSIIKFGRYAIVIAFIIAAIFTPPDPFSQIFVALILIILYYSSYYLIILVKKSLK